jgi:hypothetical protein
MLAHFDPSKPCIMETDTLDFVTAAVLSLVVNQGIFHPVTVMFRNNSPPKCNYKIHNNELQAII